MGQSESSCDFVICDGFSWYEYFCSTFLKEIKELTLHSLLFDWSNLFGFCVHFDQYCLHDL